MMKGLVLSLAVLAACSVSALLEDDVLVYTTFKPTECKRTTAPGDVLKMQYVGHLQNAEGRKFDSSYDRGEPIVFTLGAGQVIQGWDKGLLSMCAGEKRILNVPPKMGYGDMSVGDIPAGSTLVFETELVGWDDTPSVMNKVVSAATTAKEMVVSELSQIEAMLKNAARR